MESATAGSFAAWVGMLISCSLRTTERAHISHTGGFRIEARESEGRRESRLHSVVLEDTFREPKDESQCKAWTACPRESRQNKGPWAAHLRWRLHLGARGNGNVASTAGTVVVLLGAVDLEAVPVVRLPAQALGVTPWGWGGG